MHCQPQTPQPKLLGTEVSTEELLDSGKLTSLMKILEGSERPVKSRNLGLGGILGWVGGILGWVGGWVGEGSWAILCKNRV